MHNFKNPSLILTHLVIASIIPFLIWGPFFPDLIVSISSLFFLYYVFKNNKFYFFLNKPFIVFIIFCIYCILNSVFISENILLSFESSLFYFRIGVFSCFIWYLIEKDKSFLIYFYYALIICFSALVIDGYFQYFTGENISGYKLGINGIGTRTSSFFGQEYIMGSYLSRLFPLLFALFVIKKKKKFEIYFIGILFILVDILVFMSGERAAFFFMNLSAIFIIILIKEFQKFRLITFVLAIISVFFLSINYSKLSDRMFLSPLKNMEIIDGFEKIIIFTPAHDSLIRTAYNMFESQPIFGHGPKMFRIKCADQKYAEGISPCIPIHIIFMYNCWLKLVF